MDFKYKTVAEINAMSEDEREKYLSDKRTHEDDVRKKELDKAKDEAIEAAKTAAKDALDTAFKDLPEGVSKEDFDDFKIKTTAMIENIGKSTGNKGVDTGENVIKILSEKYESFYEKSESTEVKEEISKAREKSDRAKFVVSHKAFPATNVMTVSDVGTQVPSSTYQTIVTQVIGRYSKPRPYSKIMDQVDVQPLNAGTLTIFEDTTTGSFQVVEECELKPFIQYEEKDISADAEMVTALWCTTTKLRRFYPGVANRMRQTFEELLGETIPGLVLAFARTNSSAFTPLPALEIFTNPNEYDAIVSVVASLKKMGYVPNSVSLSPVGYAKLITNKTTDGAYTTQNGTSITLVGSTIKMGAYSIEVVEDPALADDEFIVGDLSLIHVGLDSEIFYLETDGRIDAETTVKTGLAVNVRSHELGKFVAMIIADGAKAGIIRETFTNVKTLITAD